MSEWLNIRYFLGANMRTQIHSRAKIYHFVLTSLAIVFLSLAIISPKSLSADSGVVEVGFEDGKVDWSNGVVRAVGLGFPSQKAKNEAHAKATAKRAGRIVAYRNLLEIVEGIHVNSHSLVKNFMLESDTINAKIQGVVRGARVTEGKGFVQMDRMKSLWK